VELKALKIIKSYISSMRNETGLNLGGFFACFLGVYPQKKPAGFFGYLPGFLNTA